MLDIGVLELVVPSPPPFFVSVCLPHAFRCLQKPEKALDSPGVGAKGDPEPLPGAGI